MISETIIHRCPSCSSTDIIRNGTNRCGNPQCHCKNCGAYRTLNPKKGYSPDERKKVLSACRERVSMRGVQRIFGVCRRTLSVRLKQEATRLPPLKETLLPYKPGDTLELDELCGFVSRRKNKRWLWIALCRRTRQVIAFVIGDRGILSCRKLWRKIHEDYRRAWTFSDFWKAHESVFPKETHQSVGRETGETAHVERWNNTLRQSLGRFVRKTLSFSKSDTFHHISVRWFINLYNSGLSLTT